ncbi:serine hydrolase domain-containing protein [Nocardia brasiliensis]|uniref:serine hydrolase domain-containing protein n=1 Tax=Nocardia brasiliensis TaxID=37326 RepID=UPI00030065FD|nr:serine hydrolase domain-containing protein [Nocardia brasiliensis]ASF11459.1 peptidase [Nocardia brasiliensis]SUB09781.1 D-alanyl-D-alanine carboxypeptidase precursor [Nocardia brasiliensis]
MRFAPLAAALAAAGLLAGCSSESSPSPVERLSDNRVRAVQENIDKIVEAGGVGVIATVTGDGKTAVLTSGESDTSTHATMPAEPLQRTRIGSITKTFTSAVILQLVAEGKVRLDEPIDTYLPGLLTGPGIDGRAITVRQVLRHQSGLPELTKDPRIDEYRAALENRTMTAAEEIAIALTMPADFAPGARYEYSNTNYIVAGMLIEKVTGAPYVEELQRRILVPLELSDTYLPGPAERDIRGPHPKGYAEIDGVVTEVSRIEPSVPWSAGAMVSTGTDLNRFFLALLAGKVVPAAELQQMRAGVPMGDETIDMSYGLGLGSTRLPCGAEYVGHTGGIYGFLTLSGATPDGRAVTYTLNKAPKSDTDFIDLLSDGLCP